MTPKFIFVTGGVVSSLGKGLAAASIGSLLEARGFRVTLLECDDAKRAWMLSTLATAVREYVAS